MRFEVTVMCLGTGEERTTWTTATEKVLALQKVLRRKLFAEWLTNGYLFRFTVVERASH